MTLATANLLVVGLKLVVILVVGLKLVVILVYDQLVGCTPLIGRTLVGKNQFRRFEGATTNKLVVQENWSYVGRITIVGCKFDAKMVNQLYEQLFPCGVVMIDDGKDKRYGRVDIKHFVFRLTLNILRRSVFLRVKLFIIFHLRNI